MPHVLAAATPSPAHVHQNAHRFTGHHPCWIRRAYSGGLYRTDHYRTCSYCGCIHPGDMTDLLLDGGTLEATTNPNKHILVTPNPIAGELVRMGSAPGPIFSRTEWPQTFRDRLTFPAAPDLEFTPSLADRIVCHFERACLEPAPAVIAQSFYAEHTTQQQWVEIMTVTAQGDHDAPLHRA